MSKLLTIETYNKLKKELIAERDKKLKAIRIIFGVKK